METEAVTWLKGDPTVPRAHGGGAEWKGGRRRVEKVGAGVQSEL